MRSKITYSAVMAVVLMYIFYFAAVLQIPFVGTIFTSNTSMIFLITSSLSIISVTGNIMIHRREKTKESGDLLRVSIYNIVGYFLIFFILFYHSFTGVL